MTPTLGAGRLAVNRLRETARGYTGTAWAGSVCFAPMHIRKQVRDHRAFLIVLGLSVVYAAIALWLTRGGAPLPPDSLEYAETARSLARGNGYTIDLIEIHAGMLPTVRHLHELHGLLRPLVLAPLFSVLGPDGALVRIPGVVFTSLLGVVTFMLARRFFGQVVSVIAGGLILVQPELALNALLDSDDVGLAFFSTAALLCFASGSHSEKKIWFLLAGLAAALGVLEKFAGCTLAVVFIVALLMDRKARRASGLAGTLMIVGPIAVAAGIYLARNYLLHGSLGFRFGPLDWLSKDQAPRYFAYFEAPPKLMEVWAKLGWQRVLALVGAQARLLGATALERPVLFIGGPAALLWLGRRQRLFAILGLSFTVVLVGLICVVYHVEPRYLLPLYPIYLTALAAAVVGAVDVLSRRVTAGHQALVRGAAAVVGCGIFIAGASSTLAVQRALGEAARQPGQCDDAVAFIRRTVGEAEPILTSSPWFVAWASDRPAVSIPTNGRRALLRISEHYGAKWLIDGLPSYGAADSSTALAALRSRGPFTPTLAYDGKVCDVYRLDAN